MFVLLWFFLVIIMSDEMLIGFRSIFVVAVVVICAVVTQRKLLNLLR